MVGRRSESNTQALNGIYVYDGGIAHRLEARSEREAQLAPSLPSTDLGMRVRSNGTRIEFEMRDARCPTKVWSSLSMTRWDRPRGQQTRCGDGCQE